MIPDTDYIFDISLLKKLDYSGCKSLFKKKLSYTNPGKDLVMRPLICSDFEKGYMELLSQLTQPGDVTKDSFTQRFNSMQLCNNTYLVVVIEDLSMSKIVGSATLYVETLISSQMKVVKKGRIEDVVVHDSQRGKHLGKLICETLLLLGKQVDCNEVTLECKDLLVKFYKYFGFELDKSQKYMTVRFSH